MFYRGNKMLVLVRVDAHCIIHDKRFQWESRKQYYSINIVKYVRIVKPNDAQCLKLV